MSTKLPLAPAANTTKSKVTKAKPEPKQQQQPITTLTTSKKWIVPPRPKPGRKPSVDTPPSKRKAQNRAAQRAFRERRAARVHELEDELSDMLKERDEKELQLKRELDNMKKDNEMLRKRLATEKEEDKKEDEKEDEKEYSMADLDRALEEKLPVGENKCGFCIKDSCLCESVGLRPEERRRNSVMEIDFTAQFAKPKKDKDKGNFCGGCGGNGSMPCVCNNNSNNNKPASVKLPPISLPTPPPTSDSENEQPSPLSSPTSQREKLPTLHPPLPSLTETVYECTGQPGNCMQCQKDPMSTLFCTSLASRAQMSTNKNGSFIPISAAYQTLSRHQDFNRHIGQLVSNLHTRGGQVEVSSIANVLRQLDRRFYD